MFLSYVYILFSLVTFKLLNKNVVLYFIFLHLPFLLLSLQTFFSYSIFSQDLPPFYLPLPLRPPFFFFFSYSASLFHLSPPVLMLPLFFSNFLFSSLELSFSLKSPIFFLSLWNMRDPLSFLFFQPFSFSVG
jgi:hypothetical protein